MLQLKNICCGSAPSVILSHPTWFSYKGVAALKFDQACYISKVRENFSLLAVANILFRFLSCVCVDRAEIIIFVIKNHFGAGLIKIPPINEILCRGYKLEFRNLIFLGKIFPSGQSKEIWLNGKVCRWNRIIWLR